MNKTLEKLKTGIHPELYELAGRVQEIAKDEGITIAFSEGFRTVSKQNELYAQGRTTPGNIVTNATGNSYSSQHQWGIAIDFYLDMDIDSDGDKKDDAFNNIEGYFDEVGRIALTVGLGWGGTWSYIVDKPHIYLPHWGNTTKQLKALYGTPDKFFQSWNRNSAIINNERKEESTISQSNNISYNEFVRELQFLTGCKVDGIAGPETISKTPTLKRGSSGDVVQLVQLRLNSLRFNCGKTDGIFGNNTELGVRNYQKSIGFKEPDGVMDNGKRTWKALLRLS